MSLELLAFFWGGRGGGHSLLEGRGGWLVNYRALYYYEYVGETF